MEQQTQPNMYANTGGNGSMPTPNSQAVLILGILSLVLCCASVVSTILSIIALVLAASGEREYKLNPQAYTLTSYKNLRTGRTCAIIGLCLSLLAIIWYIVYVVIMGAAAISMLNFLPGQ